MKFTSTILVALLVILLGGLLSSNIILKKEYDKVDKSDIFWTYDYVLKQPFRHLKIIGGNNTLIAFQQSHTSSVRILGEWKKYHGGQVKAWVKNDTLYVNFDYTPANLFEKFWLQTVTAVRIFSPELLSIEGTNTNIELDKMNQKSFSVNITGRSRFEVESLRPSFDSLTISQKDSSTVIFEMSPEYHTTFAEESTRMGVSSTQQITSKEAMTINDVSAKLEGYSLLDLGHAQIGTLQLTIADSSAIILSGGALKKLK